MGGLIFLSPSAQAYDFDFSGTFATDNEVQLLNFTVATASTVTIFSSSWGNGLGPDGYVSYGGFDPRLRVWNNTGRLIATQNDVESAGSELSNGVSYGYGIWDVYLTLSLAPGNYTLTILQSYNEALRQYLSGGFLYDENPDYTYDLGLGSEEYFNGRGSSSNKSICRKEGERHHKILQNFQ